MGVGEAVQAAKQYVGGVYANEGIGRIMLEETEREGDFWLITIGFDRPIPVGTFEEGISAALRRPPRYERVYKILTVNDASGEVESMKNR